MNCGNQVAENGRKKKNLWQPSCRNLGKKLKKKNLWQLISATIAEIHSLSSFFQITLSSIYITNKLNFLQYSAKRLPSYYLVSKNLFFVKLTFHSYAHS